MRRRFSPILVLTAVLLIVGLGVTELEAATHRIASSPSWEVVLVALIALVGLAIVDQRSEL